MIKIEIYINISIITMFDNILYKHINWNKYFSGQADSFFDCFTNEPNITLIDTKIQSRKKFEIKCFINTFKNLKFKQFCKSKTETIVGNVYYKIFFFDKMFIFEFQYFSNNNQHNEITIFGLINNTTNEFFFLGNALGNLAFYRTNEILYTKKDYPIYDITDSIDYKDIIEYMEFYFNDFCK